MRQQIAAILLGREQHEVREALDHHGRDLDQIAVPALDTPLHEVVDVAVQTIGHRASQVADPLS